MAQVLVVFPLNPVSHVFLNQRWENNRKSCNLSSVTFPSPQPGVRQQGQGGRKSVAMSHTWLPGNSEEDCWDAPTAPAESFLWLDLKNRGRVGVRKFFSISEHAGSLFLACSCFQTSWFAVTEKYWNSPKRMVFFFPCIHCLLSRNLL